MGYARAFYDLLRKDRDDAARAKVFDEWYEELPEEEKAWCDRALFNLTQGSPQGVQQAKALIVMVIILYHAKVDDQDKMRAVGEYIRAEFEWSYAGKLASFMQEEMV